LIWSAACASCALPFLFEPVELMAKDRNGAIVPYHPAHIKWMDGSVGADLPMSRLSELFNINHFIVSQGIVRYRYCDYSNVYYEVNPHVAPFFWYSESSSGFRASLFYLLKSEITHRITQVINLFYYD
jgi:TAG lipase/steryl ester hydrolase/phospholipase A2/LPA acyltransferase